MRRLKHSRRKELVFANRSVQKDAEGVTTDVYGAPFTLIGEIYSAGGKVQAQMYGERINHMYNVRIEGEYAAADGVEGYTFGDGANAKTLRVGDGMMLQSSNVDYRIINIRAEKPLRLTVEKI